MRLLITILLLFCSSVAVASTFGAQLRELGTVSILIVILLSCLGSVSSLLNDLLDDNEYKRVFLKVSAKLATGQTAGFLFFFSSQQLSLTDYATSSGIIIVSYAGSAYITKIIDRFIENGGK